MSKKDQETNQDLQYTLSALHSTAQFKVPFMLGSAVYGSFGRFHVAASWSENQLIPKSLSIHLDSSSINANFIEQTDAAHSQWSGETKVSKLEMFLETDNQLFKMPLGEALCRFKKSGDTLSMDMELEIDRAKWNSIRGLDSNVKGLLNSGPVLLMFHLSWNSVSAGVSCNASLSESQYPQIMQVATGMV